MGITEHLTYKSVEVNSIKTYATQSPFPAYYKSLVPHEILTHGKAK